MLYADILVSLEKGRLMSSLDKPWSRRPELCRAIAAVTAANWNTFQVEAGFLPRLRKSFELNVNRKPQFTLNVNQK